MCKRRSSSSNLRNHSVSYHMFPRDPILKKEWIKFCNRNDDWIPSRRSVICSDHFTAASFQLFSNIRRMLVEGAKPTLRSRYCPDVKQNVKKNKKDNVSVSKSPNSTRGQIKELASSEIIKLKNELINRSKKIKRLQGKNRYLRNKMDTLKNETSRLNEKSNIKKVKDDKAQKDENEKSPKNRSRKMSEKQDETLLSTEIGLAECRTCLQALDANSVLVDLFQCWVPPWDGMESTIAEDLAKLANIEITQTDKYSKVICEPCCLKLQSACDFACIVRKNDRVLRQRYPSLPEEIDCGNRTIWPKPIQLHKNINGTIYENVMNVEIKQEVMSEDEYTNNNAMDDSRENELATLEIKIEPEELIQPMQLATTEECEAESQVDGGNLSYAADMSYTALSGHALNDTKDDIPGMINGIDSKENIPKIKEEPMCDENEDEVTPTDLSLECILCCKEFNSVSGLKAHVIAQHSYKSVKRKAANSSPEKRPKNHEFMCVTCQRKFTTSTDLMVHETCHNKSVCYACSAKFDTFEQLTRHSRRCKAIANKELHKPKTLEDVKRPVFQEPLPVNSTDRKKSKEKIRCALCKEEFSDKYYLTIHEAIHHTMNSDEFYV
ncbi:unnamed protein product, partial [Iphiclides podalirius]